MKAMQKIKSLKCDVAIFDLEDAVAVSNKEFALKNVSSFLLEDENRGLNSRAAVRINGLDTKWGKDDILHIAEAVHQGMKLEAILVPKVDSLETVYEIENILGTVGQEKLPLWCMIETAAGVHNSHEIASRATVQALVFGSNDLSKDIRAKQTTSREPLLYAMSRVILSARMHGKVVIDGVYNNYKDIDGFSSQAKQGREIGFDGKSLIHPTQIGPCNVMYSPSEAELEFARAVIAHWSAAELNGNGSAGVVTVNGQMIERLHVEEARELVAMFGEHDQ